MDLSLDMKTIFNSLSEEKQDELARRFVHEQINGQNVQTLIIMPDSDENGEVGPDSPASAGELDMKSLVEECGEDYAVQMMKDLLKCGAVTAKAMDKKALDELFEKCMNDEATEEEKAIAAFFIENIKRSVMSRADVAMIAAKTLLDLVGFCNREYHAPTYYSDLVSALFMTIIGSMANTPDTPMARFKSATPHQNMSMVSKISKDIDEALVKSIFKDGKPNNQFLVLAFLNLAQVYAAKEDDGHLMVYGDPAVISKHLGLDQVFDDKEEDSEEKSEDDD